MLASHVCDVERLCSRCVLALNTLSNATTLSIITLPYYFSSIKYGLINILLAQNLMGQRVPLVRLLS